MVVGVLPLPSARVLSSRHRRLHDDRCELLHRCERPHPMIEHLLKACDICETNGIVGSLRNVKFHDGRLSAFNGILHYQAPSTLDPAENFEVSHEKLAKALRACGEGM